jgi:amidase
MTANANAFVPGEPVCLGGEPRGSLSGRSFAAKDLFDVAGQVTGCGNPDWLRTHPPAQRTAVAIEMLLEAGASLMGKTITDELAFSLEGRNAHYGTPRNPSAPGRIPGGSSSGSASAVASGLVDFALGTDTGGSVRIPAALCGTYGIRPTHGSVSLEGVMPFSPSYDTVGWMARDPELLREVGDVLLPPAQRRQLGKLLLVQEMVFLSDPEVAEAFGGAYTAIGRSMGELKPMRLEAWTGMSPEGWMDTFRTIQGYEIAIEHSPWIESVRPRFAPDIAYRFDWSRSITQAAAEAASPRRELFAERLEKGLEDGAVLCLPTAPTTAPELSASDQVYRDYRHRTLISTSISGLSRCPQVTLPIPSHLKTTDLPVGFSLIAARGSDRALLDLAAFLATEMAG